jgi:hypothetical protein
MVQSIFMLVSGCGTMRNEFIDGAAELLVDVATDGGVIMAIIGKSMCGWCA